MTNPLGTKEETRVREWFNAHGWPYARRLAKSGAKDEGDISLGDGIAVVVEVKARKSIDLAGYMRVLEEKVANTGFQWGFVVIKKRGTQDAGEYYCVLPLKYLNVMLVNLYAVKEMVREHVEHIGAAVREVRMIRRKK